MEMKLKVAPIESTEGGRIFLYKKIDGQLHEMGNVKYDYDAERKWLLRVLMESHPHVTLIE